VGKDILEMERIAVTFTGRVKAWEGQLAYLKSLKELRLPVDFFCSAGCYKEEFDAFVAALEVVSADYVTYATDLPIDSYPHMGPGTCPYNIFSQAFHMKNVGRLIKEHAAKHGYEYKAIIRWRADLICHTPFPMAWPIPANTVFIPHDDDCGPGINDRCAYGDAETMLKLYDLYDSMQGFGEAGVPLQAELYLLKHIRAAGIQTQRYELSTAFNEGRF
jgi:hypothetical protein